MRLRRRQGTALPPPGVTEQEATIPAATEAPVAGVGAAPSTAAAKAAPSSPAVAAAARTDATAPAATRREGQEETRSSVAELGRKLGTRTYAGAAALVMALATAIVAIVLAVDARDDSAGQDDVTRIENQISDLSSQAAAGQSAQGSVASLDARVAALEDQLGSGSADEIEDRLAAIEDDLEDLRKELSASDGSDAGGGSGPTGPGASAGSSGSGGGPGDENPGNGGTSP